MSPTHFVVFEHLLRDVAGSVNELLRERFKLSLLDLVRLPRTGMLTRQRRLRPDRQTAFCIFHFQSQELITVRIVAWVRLEFLEKLFRNGIEQRLVPVDATEIEITRTRDHVDFVLLIADQRKVEGTATEVVNQDSLFIGQFGEPQPLSAQDVAQRSGNRLIDEVDAFQSGLPASLECGPSLQVAELCRNRDDSLLDFSDLILCRVEQFFQNNCSNVCRRVIPAANAPALLSITHKPLGVLDDVFRFDDRVSKSLGADNDFT